MMITTLLETDYATLWYYPEAKIVHHAFHKYIYGAQFRAVMRRGLDHFQEQRLTKWLSDDRRNSALPQADLDWSLEEWFPGMLEAGWKYWAVVLPENAVGRQNMERVINTYEERGLTIKTFSEPNEALEWLQSV